MEGKGPPPSFGNSWIRPCLRYIIVVCSGFVEFKEPVLVKMQINWLTNVPNWLFKQFVWT